MAARHRGRHRAGFLPASHNIDDFKDISYSLSFWSSSTPDYEFQKAYERALATADAIIASMVDEIREYAPENSYAEAGAPDQLCLRFHAAARALQARHNGRATLEINDEYEVQDLFRAFLRLHFDDIRPEEWTPSYGGRSSRVDFLLKAERIVVEIKKTRASMKAGDLGEQLIIDRAVTTNIRIAIRWSASSMIRKDALAIRLGLSAISKITRAGSRFG